MQQGDVVNTLSDNKIIDEWIGAYSMTPVSKGVNLFLDWFTQYYK